MCDWGDSPAARRWRSRSSRRTTWSTSSLWLRAICTRDSSGEPQGRRRRQRGGKKDPKKRKSDMVVFFFLFLPASTSPSALICLFPPSRIMMLSVLKNTKTPVKFWFLKNYLSPTFKVRWFKQSYGFSRRPSVRRHPSAQERWENKGSLQQSCESLARL